MPHDYTAQTPNGDKHFQTEHHHSAFASIEDFIERHKAVLGLAASAAGTAVTTGVSLWLGRGKTGLKLK